MVAGVLASIFGRFFQGAIGRDREFRADAASAQAMGSTSPVLVALRKIGGIPKRSFLDNPAAPESGHLFFSEAWQGLASTFFPTHPTLEDRIRRLHPEWGGDFIASLARKVEGDPESGEGVGPSGEPASAAAKAAAAIGARKREKAKAKELAETMSAKVYPAANLEFLGWSMLPAQFATASAARRALRDDWVRETKTQEGAKALLLEMMRSGANPTSRLSGATPTQMLSLLDLSMPLLRRMALDEYYFLIKRCRHELTRMEEIDTVRFLLLHVARRRLALGLGLRQVDSVVFEELPSVWGECHVLVTIMLRFGAPTASARSSARLAAWNAIGYETPPPTLDGVTVVDMVDALDICSQCSPLLKKRILTACGLAASYQGNIPEREMAILRMFADAMGAPVPLLSTRKMEPAQVAPAQ